MFLTLMISGFFVSFWSCSKPHLMKEDLIGQWKSNRNEVLTLYADSTFSAKDNIINSYIAKKIFYDSSETTINGKGTWQIYKNNLCLNYVKFYLKNGEMAEKQYGFVVPIKASGFLENRLPWKIISLIGEDEGHSIFQKVE